MGAVKKMIPLKTETLSELIDTAGGVNSRIGVLKKEYDGLRQRIADEMPTRDTDGNIIPSTTEYGEEFQAVHEYQAVRSLDAKGLFELDEDLFWQLVKVDIGLAEKVLDQPTLHSLLSVEFKDKPTLTISKIKKGK